MLLSLILIVQVFAADCVKNVELADAQRIVNKELPQKKVYDCVKNECICFDDIKSGDMPNLKLEGKALVVDNSEVLRQTELRRKLKSGEIKFDEQGFQDLLDLLKSQY